MVAQTETAAAAVPPVSPLKAFLNSWSPEFLSFASYLAFLALFCATIFAPRNADPYFMQKGLEDIFTHNEFDYGIDFTNINSREQMISWFDKILVPGLWPIEDYAGEALDELEQGFVGTYNKVVGTVRIRTVKVVEDSCNIPKMLQGKIKECYGQASEENERTDDFGNVTHNLDNGLGGDLFIKYEKEAESSWLSPTTKLRYSGGGQTHEFNTTRALVTPDWNQMKAQGWLTDPATRAVFVNVNLYNPNVDLVSAARFSIEISASGAIYPSAQIRCLPLIRPVRVLLGDGASAYDGGVFILEMCFYGAVLAYCAVEIYIVRDHGHKYFKSMWNVMEFVNLVLFVVVGFLRMSSLFLVGSSYDEFGTSDHYVDLDYVVYFARQVENVNSFNAVLSFMKLFKFARENKKLSQLIDTLELASVDMMSIVVIIAVISTGYGIAFHIAFGHAVTEYRDFTESLFTLFLATLGDFDMDELRSYNQVLGAFLFVTFIVIMFFIIISMFLAIVDSAYEAVREGLADKSNELDPLTKDVLRVVTFPAVALSTIYHLFVGEGASINPEEEEMKKKVKELEEKEEEQRIKEKTMTPESLEREARKKMEHEFKGLYDEAMGRIQELTATQNTLQGVLNKISGNMDRIAGTDENNEGGANAGGANEMNFMNSELTS